MLRVMVECDSFSDFLASLPVIVTSPVLSSPVAIFPCQVACCSDAQQRWMHDGSVLVCECV